MSDDLKDGLLDDEDGDESRGSIVRPTSGYSPRVLGVRRGGFRKRVRRIRGPIDYKDVEFLGQFITDQGKIMPRRLTRVSAKDQRSICAAIKRARMVGLLPYAKRA